MHRVPPEGCRFGTAASSSMRLLRTAHPPSKKTSKPSGSLTGQRRVGLCPGSFPSPGSLIWRAWNLCGVSARPGRERTRLRETPTDLPVNPPPDLHLIGFPPTAHCLAAHHPMVHHRALHHRTAQRGLRRLPLPLRPPRRSLRNRKTHPPTPLLLTPPSSVRRGPDRPMHPVARIRIPRRTPARVLPRRRPDANRRATRPLSSSSVLVPSSCFCWKNAERPSDDGRFAAIGISPIGTCRPLGDIQGPWALMR
jgi:hypothetical protein